MSKMVINACVVDNSQGEIERDNIWQPIRLRSPSEFTTKEERAIEELNRTIIGQLNKLSPVNYCKIVGEFKSLINNHSLCLGNIVSLIVEKAITEPLFTKCYLEMVCSLIDMSEVNEIEKTISGIRELFISKVFELLKDIANFESDSQKRAEMKAERAELEPKINFDRSFIQIKCRGVGYIVAESFILGIVPTSVVIQCIETLFSLNDENSLECLNNLWSNAGKCLEFQIDETELNSYVKSMQIICDDTSLPLRIRCLFLNLIEYTNNSWTSKSTLSDLNTIEYMLNELSSTYKSDTSVNNESEFQIDAKQAQYVNKILNKFTDCHRNLMVVLNSFNELGTDEKSRLIEVFITCVVKGYIYSEDCGKLFVALLQSLCVDVTDVIYGIKEVISRYCQNLIFADEQIWTRLKEIFKPMLINRSIKVEQVDLDALGVDVKGIEKYRKVKKKNKTTGKGNIYDSAQKLKTCETKGASTWRRGVPVKDRVKIKKNKDVDKQSDASQQESEENVEHQGEVWD